MAGRLDGDETRAPRAQMGARLALLRHSPGLRILEDHGRRLGVRRALVRGHAPRARHAARPAAPRRPRRLPLPARDRSRGRHAAQQRLRPPRAPRGADRLGVPPVGRRHHLPVPHPLELLRRHLAAQGGRNPAHGEPRGGAGPRLRGAAPPRRARTPRIRSDLRLRDRRLRQPPLHGRRQRPEPALDGLPGRRGRGRPRIPQHAPLRVERRQPLLLPRRSDRGHRRSARRIRHGGP